MSSCGERTRPPGVVGRSVRILAVALVLLAAVLGGGELRAQDEAAQWNAAVEQGLRLIGEPDVGTAELEQLRQRLLRLRSQAFDRQAAEAPKVADINARLQALGPAPAEGTSEAPELVQRRAQLNAELSQAQVPMVDAQDFQRRADALIRDIDRLVRGRFAAELGSMGPSPLLPSHWIETIEALVSNSARIRAIVEATLNDDVQRAEIVRQVPVDLSLALLGIAITFVFRVRLTNWVESGLEHATRPRTIALLVTLRSFSRLIVPAVGVGFLFAALDPARLLDSTAPSPLFDVPDFALAIIGAAWVGGSLFAPRLKAYRLAPLDDVMAHRASRLALALGIVIAIKLLLTKYIADWELTPAAAATLEFPLFLLGGLSLWGASRVLRACRKALAAPERTGLTQDRSGSIETSLLGFVERASWTIAFAAPFLASIGFFALANYLLYGAILTLGLAGASVVIYAFLLTVFEAVFERLGAERGGSHFRDGLLPIVLMTVVVVGSLPFLALVWGARPADLVGVWYHLRDGVTLGGMRISIGMVASFALVFGVLYALSRLLQSVLRHTVLPRTKMDAGGRNAVLAGVGYTGFFLAVIVAVSSTGIDLTSLAVVAGALSVGIGFGLQTVVSNFVSGIILLVERPIKEGDWIEVGGFSGYVRGISVRSTEIETFDRASVILPNSDLIAGAVLNRTHTGMSGRLTVPVGVGYNSDPRKVVEILSAIAEDHPMVLLDPAPRVLFMAFGADSLDFEIRCWLRDVNFSLSARSDMNFEILERFAAAGITIPFQQREVRIVNMEEMRADLSVGPGPAQGKDPETT